MTRLRVPLSNPPATPVVPDGRIEDDRVVEGASRIVHLHVDAVR